MKFALKFSIGLKIAVSCENPGGLANFFLQGGAGCLGGGSKNFAVKEGAEPLGGARKSRGEVQDRHYIKYLKVI